MFRRRTSDVDFSVGDVRSPATLCSSEFVPRPMATTATGVQHSVPNSSRVCKFLDREEKCPWSRIHASSIRAGSCGHWFVLSTVCDSRSTRTEADRRWKTIYVPNPAISGTGPFRQTNARSGPRQYDRKMNDRKIGELRGVEGSSARPCMFLSSIFLSIQ